MSELSSGLWRHWGFRRLWIGETISAFGSEIGYLALNLVAVALLGAGPAQVGTLTAAFLAPGIVLGLTAGAWVDRVRRRPLLIALNLMQAATLITIPLAAVLDGLTLGQLYVVSLVGGTLVTFTRPAFGAFLPILVGREHIEEANAKLSMTESLATTLGPGLAGVLVQVLGAARAIAVDALSFAVAAAFLGTIRTADDVPVPRSQRRHLISEIREGLHLTLVHPLLRSIAVTEVLLRFFQLIVVANYVVFIVALFGPAAALVFGIVTVPGGVGGLVGAALSPRMKRTLGLGVTFTVGATFLAVSPFFMVFATGDPWVGIPLLGAAALVGATGDAITGIHMQSVQQRTTPNRPLGRVTATEFVVVGAAALLGSLAGGTIGEAFGPRAAILAAAVGHLLVFVWISTSPLVRIGRDESEDPPSPGT